MLSFVQLDSLPYQCSSRYFENALHRLTLYVLTYTTCQMSKTFIGGGICREFKLEALAEEEMLDCVVCSCRQFSFQMGHDY